MKFKNLIAGIAFSIVALSCKAGWDDPTAVHSQDYPCGATGRVCDVMPRWQDDTCCGEDELCPGPHAGDCMAGYCCANGSFTPGAYGAIADDGGVSPKALHTVRPAR